MPFQWQCGASLRVGGRVSGGVGLIEDALLPALQRARLPRLALFWSAVGWSKPSTVHVVRRGANKYHTVHLYVPVLPSTWAGTYHGTRVPCILLVVPFPHQQVHTY
jgi:hypothetical protein